MASVAFGLVPPDQENLAALHIYEAPEPDGPFVEIDVVTEIGSYPDYLDRHTTESAINSTDWFAVRWEDANGALSALSASVMGGTSTLVDEIVRRVRERGISVDLHVIVQETEAAIEIFTGKDPYSIESSTVSYKAMSGLTYLVLARCYMTSAAIGSVQQVSIGLVSMREGTSAVSTDVDKLMSLAEEQLGMNVSRVLQMHTPRRRHLYAVVTEP